MFIELPYLIIAILIIVNISLLIKLRNVMTHQGTKRNNDVIADDTSAMQLNALEARLNPHLFKNILNSIQSHAYQTYFSLDKLASVLDYILYDSRNKFVTPRQEITFALNLIEIHKIKVSPLFELKVKTRIDESDEFYELPLIAPMVSTDLIENAFKHADLQSADAFISVIFQLNDHQFSVTVSNKISEAPVMLKEKRGIGSQTLEQRLQIIYGTCHELKRIKEKDTYIAHLKINLLEYKAKMHSS